VTAPFDPEAAGAFSRRKRLPAWPIAALLGGTPAWWLLGVADFAWVVIPLIMAWYLATRTRVRAPRGFAVWLVFLLWMFLSVTQLESSGSLIQYGYRALQYFAATILVLYVYNSARDISTRYITGSATVLWLTTIVGGFLGMLLPTTEYRSPLSYILPRGLLENDLVNHMVIRRFSQFNADAWVEVDPRPSAPYLYTNNWGNAYSLLLPLVLIYLMETRRTKRFWWVAASVPISLVPAVATMNRGMFIGVGIVIAYIAIRYGLMGNMRVLLACAAAGVAGALVLMAPPIQAQLQDRLDNSGTNESRSSVYKETLQDVSTSPLLGMGAPRANENPKLPPKGSHGQFWIVIYSHGIPATIAFVAWFIVAFFRSIRRRDFATIASGAVILASLVEFTFYGFLPVGLSLLMIASGLALRNTDSPAATAPTWNRRQLGIRAG